jgi:hypothetical protein
MAGLVPAIHVFSVQTMATPDLTTADLRRGEALFKAPSTFV